MFARTSAKIARGWETAKAIMMACFDADQSAELACRVITKKFS